MSDRCVGGMVGAGARVLPAAGDQRRPRQNEVTILYVSIMDRNISRLYAERL